MPLALLYVDDWSGGSNEVRSVVKVSTQTPRTVIKSSYWEM